MTQKTLKVFLAGRSELSLKKLQVELQGIPHAEIESLWIPAVEVDPLGYLTTKPDIVVLELGVDPDTELDHLAKTPLHLRPVIFLVGPPDNTALMRKALQAGVRDFFVRPADPNEVAAALRRVVKEKLESGSRYGQVTVFMNAKGGSGATLIASNVAHIMSAELGFTTALFDFDFQFGSVGLNFDLHATHTTAGVISDIDEVDLVALEAYMSKHRSGLNVLTHSSQEISLPGEIPDVKVKRLIELSRRLFDHIVIDIPRLFDPVLASVIDEADRFVLVMQQSVVHVRDTKRLLQILRTDMNVPDQRLLIIVNRYSDRSSMSLADLSESFRFNNFFALPNDYQTVAQSTNVGQPLLEFARDAPITRDLVALTESLTGRQRKPSKTLLRRLFPFLD
jgi:pilus assembly protein CpaE